MALFIDFLKTFETIILFSKKKVKKHQVLKVTNNQNAF